MKRAILLVTLLLAAAGYVFLQTPSAGRELATIMPGGAALYLEAQDFGGLLREWNASKVKADWLRSTNYAVFSRSNLFQKLGGVYQEYGETAGFLPDLKSVAGLAGTHSALALYDVREVEFLYITRVSQTQFAQSALAAVRDKFEQRQAGGVPFYLRTDPSSNRTVAFALSDGYLLLATRDDLIARALTLLAGGADPSVASEPWYHEAAAAAPHKGELRLVMSLEALVKSVYFRSYWIQGNASALREYWTGVADVNRSRTEITETRTFLRRPESAAPQRSPADLTAAASLVALVPPQAGMYKAYTAPGLPDAAALILTKLIAAGPRSAGDRRYAPAAASPDERAGTEADLETRIDEPAMAADSGISDALGAVRSALNQTGVNALLEAQSSETAGESFIRTPSVIVLAGSGDWNAAGVRTALSSAAGALWAVSGLGAGWTNVTLGNHSVELLDGLGTLLFAIRGPMLFLGNDQRLLSATLDRAGTAAAGPPVTYAAGFRHARERANYEAVMKALDFTSPGARTRFGVAPQSGVPAFFSENLASLSRVVTRITDVTVTERDDGNVAQRIVYKMAP